MAGEELISLTPVFKEDNENANQGGFSSDLFTNKLFAKTKILGLIQYQSTG